MLLKPAREFVAAVVVSFQLTRDAGLVELLPHCDLPPDRWVSGGIIIKADNDVTAVACGELCEYRSEKPLRGYLLGDSCGRHRRFLHLESSSGARYEISTEAFVFNPAIDMQAAVRGGLGACPSDGADGRAGRA